MFSFNWYCVSLIIICIICPHNVWHINKNTRNTLNISLFKLYLIVDKMKKLNEYNRKHNLLLSCLFSSSLCLCRQWRTSGRVPCSLQKKKWWKFSYSMLLISTYEDRKHCSKPVYIRQITFVGQYRLVDGHHILLHIRHIIRRNHPDHPDNHMQRRLREGQSGKEPRRSECFRILEWENDCFQM